MFRINMLILNYIIILVESVTPGIRDGKESLSNEEIHILMEKGKFLSSLSQASLFLLLMVILFGFFFIMSRINKIKKKRESKAAAVSEMTAKELEALLGDDLSEGFISLDKMSRDELRILAKKELEKEGRKPGEIEYLKGPLDWDDVDEDFQPRPKVIRSDLSKQIIPKPDENNGAEISDEDINSPPEDMLE
ncbi:MAG: hypothetical protein ABIG42_10680 [bacterium]